MLQLDHISKAHGKEEILADVILKIDFMDKIGLIGPNGCGKTTLLKIVSGDDFPDDGNIVKNRDLEIGILPQEIIPGNDKLILDEILSKFKFYKEYQEFRQAQPQVKSFFEYLSINETAGSMIGFNIEARIFRVLHGLGFSEADLKKRLDQLSGGFRMRVCLASLLIREHGLLLLDEPTNHLDIESTMWLEQFIKNYKGAVVVVSHDRYFLNRIATKIAHLENTKLTLVKGNYDDFLVLMEEEKERQFKEYEKQQKEISHIQSYIDKYIGQPKRSRMVSSRKKMLERLEVIEAPSSSDGPKIRFHFPQPERSGKIVMELTHIKKAFGDRVLYQDLELAVGRGEKIALVGPNGSGKSTLLKMMADELDFEAGVRTLGYNTDMYYYSQFLLEKLDPDKTVYQEAYLSSRNHTTVTIRAVLGAFLFSGDSIEKRVFVLSGGEKARLAICKMILSSPNFLLMDEPTNHLDMISREVLEDALNQYEGTIVFISHDRYFINRVANKVIEVFNGTLNHFPGNFNDYLPKSAFLKVTSEGIVGADHLGNSRAARQEISSGFAFDLEQKKSAQGKKDQKRQAAEQRKTYHAGLKTIKDQLVAVESRIHQLEELKKEIEQTLTQVETYQSKDRMAVFLKELDKIMAELDPLYLKWGNLETELTRYQGQTEKD